MKKILYLFIICLVIIFTIGCRKKEDSKILENVNEITLKQKKINKLILNYTEHDFNCEVSTQNIIDFGYYNNLFISKDGDLYQWDFKLFSNEQNCKKVETTIKFKKFINDVLIDLNGNPYTFSDNKLEEGITFGWIGGIPNEMYNKYKDMFRFSKYDYDSYDSNRDFAVVKYNTVYEISQANYPKTELIEIGSIPEDEKIIGLYSNIIKTDKNYYNNQIINKEECNKYADVECKYGVVRFDSISDLYDEIQFYSGTGFVILKDKPNIIYSRW